MTESQATASMSDSPENGPSENDPLESILSGIKRTRDELKLKMHLGSADARDEWEKLEARFAEVEKRAEPLTSAAKEAAEAAGEQAEKVAGAAYDVAARELKSGYEKLKKMFG